ncbi:MAG: hypothetical protein D6731_23005 [Planctomycetota bacterium]|nr:MAG: hypothetical protein D6731_23005 [Planctomycetota bacterium]
MPLPSPALSPSAPPAPRPSFPPGGAPPHCANTARSNARGGSAARRAPLPALAIGTLALVLAGPARAEDPEPVETFAEALSALAEPDAERRAEGALRLAEVLDAAQRALGEDLAAPETRKAAAKALRAYAAAAVPALARLLRGPSREGRRRAALALARLGPLAAPAATALGAALSDESTTVRRRAAKALERLGRAAAPAAPALGAALADASSTVRRRAARALGALGARARPYAPALAGLLRDEHTSVRRAAAEALAALGGAPPPGSVEGLLAGLRGRDDGLRAACARALGAYRAALPARGLRLLGALAKADPSARVRRAARHALGGRG